VNVLFDHNLSPRLAHALNGFVRAEGHAAYALRERFAPDARDTEWIGSLGQSAEEWIVVSGDRRITRNPAERAAWRSAGLRGFFLARGWRNIPLHQQAARIIWRWPDMLRQAELVEGALAMELPLGWSSRLRALPI
jgi:hypothetical protein